jgi:hypothetical protein
MAVHPHSLLREAARMLDGCRCLNKHDEPRRVRLRDQIADAVKAMDAAANERAAAATERRKISAAQRLRDKIARGEPYP